MFKAQFKKLVSMLASVFALVAMAVSSSFAALSSTDMTAVKDNITTSVGDYYVIGGVILGVIAGIWAFRKLLGLLGSR